MFVESLSNIWVILHLRMILIYSFFIADASIKTYVEGRQGIEFRWDLLSCLGSISWLKVEWKFTPVKILQPKSKTVFFLSRRSERSWWHPLRVLWVHPRGPHRTSCSRVGAWWPVVGIWEGRHRLTHHRGQTQLRSQRRQLRLRSWLHNKVCSWHFVWTLNVNISPNDGISWQSQG